MSSSATKATVTTAHGTLVGTSAAGVRSFLGVPYAAPLAGIDRFRPPQPVSPWTGERDATSYGPTAPALPYPAPFDQFFPQEIIDGDDFLNLNIWRPDNDSTGLPVFVWIHGGAFVNGSGASPTYDGSAFARDGIVCVTINYRLGAFGFLLTDDGTPNLGILDQLAALQWVQQYIASFGGDPARVTVGGESAGAMSVGTLLSLPQSAGLFQRAIPQSGAGHHALTAATARVVSAALADKLGVEPTIAAIGAIDTMAILHAQAAVNGEVQSGADPARWAEAAVNGMPFEPIVDGSVLPQLPISAIATGAGSSVDILIGTTAEESRLFTQATGVIDMINDDVLAMMAGTVGLSPAAVDAYRAKLPDASPGIVLTDIQTDFTFRIPAVRLAEARADAPGRTWMYQFAWPTPQHGACHAGELPFVFHTLDAAGTELFTGTNPPVALADEVHGAWVRFIRDGDPGWPTYDTTRRAVHRFATPSALIDDPDAPTRVIWDGLR